MFFTYIFYYKFADFSRANLQSQGADIVDFDGIHGRSVEEDAGVNTRPLQPLIYLVLVAL